MFRKRDRNIGGKFSVEQITEGNTRNTTPTLSPLRGVGHNRLPEAYGRASDLHVITRPCKTLLPD
jgi:hypothetical protein